MMEDCNMWIRNKIRLGVIGVLIIFSGGCTTQNIDDQYLVISDISTISPEDNHGTLTLRIKGDYGESAWGIKQINHKAVKNVIILSGTLEFGGTGEFEYEVNIPPCIDSVKFYSRVLWTRRKADAGHTSE